MGLQPLFDFRSVTWGVAPGWDEAALVALDNRVREADERRSGKASQQVAVEGQRPVAMPAWGNAP